MSDTDCNKLVALIIVIILAPEKKKSSGRILYTLTSLALQNQVQF